MEKRSILGLNTVKVFIITMLSLAIIAIVTLLVMGTLTTDSIKDAGSPKYTGSIVNDTLAGTVTETGRIMPTIGDKFRALCTITQCVNVTGGKIIPLANYSRTNCNVAWTGADPVDFNNTLWKCSYTYSYKDDSGIVGVTNNVSTGLIGFFTNAVTYFALLGVVVIILIISLVVVVVNRFGGETATPSGAGESI